MSLEYNYRLLASKIVEQAVRDYKYLLLRDYQSKTFNDQLLSQTELEAFFRGDQLSVLTPICGEDIINKSRKDIKRVKPLYDHIVKLKETKRKTYGELASFIREECEPYFIDRKIGLTDIKDWIELGTMPYNQDLIDCILDYYELVEGTKERDDIMESLMTEILIDDKGNEFTRIRHDR